MTLLVKPSNEKPGRPPAKRARAAEWLTDYLYLAINHEALAKDVEDDARQVNITLHTLDRAAKLDVSVKRIQRNRAWWWQLPKETVDLMDAAAEDEDDAVSRPPTCSSQSSPGVRGSSRNTIRRASTRSTERSGGLTNEWRRRAASRTSRRGLGVHVASTPLGTSATL